MSNVWLVVGSITFGDSVRRCSIMFLLIYFVVFCLVKMIVKTPTSVVPGIIQLKDGVKEFKFIYTKE